MNEDLITKIMGDVDPARDLTDDALDTLVPNDHLMQRIALELREEALPRQRRVPLWRRWPMVVGEGVAALTVGAVASLSLLSSTPVIPSWSISAPQASVNSTPLAPTHHGSQGVEYTAASSLPLSLGPAATPLQVVTRVSSSDVVNGRYVKKIVLDNGALIIAPAPATVSSGMTLSQASTIVWATSQLDGSQQQVFGFGQVSLTAHNASVHAVKNVYAFVGLATGSNTVYHCPSMNAGASTSTTVKLPSNGEVAAVLSVSAQTSTFGPPIASGPYAFVYRAASSPCGKVIKRQLSPATEQVSVAWAQAGPVKDDLLPIIAVTPGCGQLAGYSATGSKKSVTVTVNGLIPETKLFDYCTAALQVHESIRLGPPTNSGAKTPPPLVTSSTKILYAPVGPVRATK